MSSSCDLDTKIGVSATRKWTGLPHRVSRTFSSRAYDSTVNRSLNGRAVRESNQLLDQADCRIQTRRTQNRTQNQDSPSSAIQAAQILIDSERFTMGE